MDAAGYVARPAVAFSINIRAIGALVGFQFDWLITGTENRWLLGYIQNVIPATAGAILERVGAIRLFY